MFDFLGRFMRSPIVLSLVLSALIFVSVDSCATEKSRRVAVERALVANARADTFSIRYDSLSQAFEERGKQLLEARALTERVRAVNAALGAQIDTLELQVEDFVQTVATLEAELESAATVEQTGETEFSVELNEQISLAGGGGLTVTGSVRIETTEPSVLARLSASGEFPLSIVLSRNEDQEVVVHAFTGDPRLVVSSVDVTSRLLPLTDQGGSSRLSSVLNKVFVSPEGWANRMIGAAVGFAVCRL